VINIKWKAFIIYYSLCPLWKLSKISFSNIVNFFLYHIIYGQFFVILLEKWLCISKLWIINKKISILLSQNLTSFIGWREYILLRKLKNTGQKKGRRIIYHCPWYIKIFIIFEIKFLHDWLIYYMHRDESSYI